MEEIKCPRCGESENLHPNYDYSKKDMPIENYLCNECGQIFTEKPIIYEQDNFEDL